MTPDTEDESDDNETSEEPSIEEKAAQKVRELENEDDEGVSEDI